MAVSVLGKRTRGAPGLQQEQQRSTRRCTRRTRSFQQGNDENEDPENTLSIEADAEDQSESEEVAFFSPSVTRTPSARRTKDIFKFEASDYRELNASLWDLICSRLMLSPNSCQGPHNTFDPSSPRCFRQSARYPPSPGHVCGQVVSADDAQDPSDAFNIADNLPSSSAALLAEL